MIGRITPSGVITKFPLPVNSDFPASITKGPDNNLWFTVTQGTSKIGRITSSGVITTFSLPSGNNWANNITSGSDGNLWFTFSDRTSGLGGIGRMTLNGVITEFPLPNGNSDPYDITSGPDGNLWFTNMTTDSDNTTKEIGRITLSGVITEFPTNNSSFLYGITSGPDNKIWFIDSTSSIGWMTLSGGASIPFNPPPLTTLCIKSFKNSTDETSMSKQYTIEAKVTNLTQNALSDSLKITESGAAKSYNDTQKGPVITDISSLYPGTTQTITIPYSHHWRWLLPLEKGNNDNLVEFLVNNANGILSEVVKGGSALSGIFDVLNVLSTYHKALVSNTYTYSYNLPTCQPDVPHSAKVKVIVQDSKRYQLASSIASDMLSGKATTFGIFSAFTGAGIPAAIFGLGSEVELKIFSKEMLKSAEDPDPNYTEIVQPTPVPLPNIQTLTGKDADALTHLANAIGFAQAEGKAQAKSDGAAEDGNTDWTTLQLRYAKKFLTQTLYELHGYIADDKTLNTIQAQYIASPSALTQVTNYLQQNGLPPTERDWFTQLGYISDEINEVLKVQLLTMPIFQGKYASADPSVDLLPPVENLLSDVNGQLASISAKTIDTTPPITKITFQGTLGKNNTYVSPVQVTITASDDATGSGIKTIEYSLDNENTWHQYISPFMFSADGMYSVLSRAIDIDGNTQFTPSDQNVTINLSQTLLGGMDLEGYCHYHGKGKSMLQNSIWMCTKNATVIDLTKACIWQYGKKSAFASQNTVNNPYTWSCYIPQADTLPPSPTPSIITNIQNRLGGIDLNSYCKMQGKGRALLKKSNWICKNDKAETKLTDACIWQYKNSNAFASQDISGNTYTWSCYSNGTAQIQQ